jgi:hypothetical protein
MDRLARALVSVVANPLFTRVWALFLLGVIWFEFGRHRFFWIYAGFLACWLVSEVVLRTSAHFLGIDYGEQRARSRRGASDAMYRALTKERTFKRRL